MEKWKKWKRFLSVLLSISMVVGLMAVVEPRKVEASGENITWKFKSFSGSGELRCTHSDYPSDVADYYSVKAYVDGSVTATTTFLETQYPWDGTNDTVIQGLSALESVYIPAGTILQEYNTETWSEVSGGKTLVLSNALYIVNDNGVWKEADPNALSLSFGTVDGSENWYLSPSAVPSYEQYYRFATVEIDGVEYENAVWLEFTSANSVIIYAGGFETGNGVPKSSFYISKGTVLKGKGNDPWAADTGNDLTVTNDLYVEYIDGTWQVTAWYPQDHTTMENGGYNMPERAINLISNGDFNSGITNSNCIGNSSVSNKMLSMDITGTDDYFQIYGISLTKGVTYKLTYYMWASDASNLQYNMYADGPASPAGGWKDFVLTSSISENTEGWQKLEVEWTAPETGEAVFGFKNYNATGSAKIWIDDIALYDTAIPEPVEIEVGFDWISGATIAFTSDLGNEALAEIYGSSCDATGSIVVEGQTYTVTYTLSNGQLVIWALPDAYGNASKIQIQEGMELVFPSSSRPLTIKNTLTLEKNAAGNWYVSDVTEHTQLGGNPLPDDMTNLIEGGDCSSQPTNSSFVSNTEVVDGMVHMSVNGAEGHYQIYGISVKEGHTYKISYYIWINGASSLKYNMYAAGFSASSGWEDWIMGNDASLTSDTNAWTEVEFDWTATETGELVLGFKNYDPNGSAQIYLDDIVVYDTTPNLVESSADMTFSKIVNDSQLEFYVPNDAIKTLIDTEEWLSSTANVVINGIEVEVDIYTTPYNASAKNRYFYIHGKAVKDAIAAGKMTLTGPMVSTFGDEKITFNIADGTIIEKVGSAWGAYTGSHEYPNQNKVSYYNIDNGTTYVLTSSNNAIEVRKNDTVLDVKAGEELNEVGTYDITRIEQDTKFVQRVVLYKSGDAHVDENDSITAADLVAVKWAALAENDNSLGEQFAADVNRSGTVDKFDAKVMRKALLSDSPNTYFAKVKGNTSLNGEMPIIGFDGPYESFLEGKSVEKVYADIAELGINTVVLNREELASQDAIVQKHLSAAEGKDMKLYLWNGYVSDKSNEHGIAFANNAVEFVSQTTAKYDYYTSFGGYFIYDEPMYDERVDDIYHLGELDLPLQTIKPYTNIHTYLNLVPYFSGLVKKQVTDSWWDNIRYSEMTYDNYSKYINKASEVGVEALSYDLYLRDKYDDGTYVTQTKQFWTNLDWMRKISLNDTNHNPFYAFVQVGNDFKKDNTEASSKGNLPTIQEMYLEANVALAMGAKGINYYSLIQPEEWAKNTDGTMDYSRSGLINYLGEKNNGGSHGENYHYYDAAKKINAYIKAVDEVLMNATSEAVITTNSTVAGYLENAVSKYGSIASINNKEVLVGCFDYYGQEAFMVVNITPDAGNSGSSQSVTLTFDGKKSGQYIDMNYTEWQALNSSNTLTLNIPAGEAVVIVLD